MTISGDGVNSFGMTEELEVRLTGNTVGVGALAVVRFLVPEHQASRLFDDWNLVREEVRAVVERHVMVHDV